MERSDIYVSDNWLSTCVVLPLSDFNDLDIVDVCERTVFVPFQEV